MKRNRPELALLRGKRDEEAVARWMRSFARGDQQRATAYLSALQLFLGATPASSSAGWQRYIGTLSPNTRASYSYALTEFFEWAAAESGHLLEPSQITQHHAEQFVQWLATRPFELSEEKLRDGDSPTRLAIYETVKRLGATHIADIAAALPNEVTRAHQLRSGGRDVFDMAWLDAELGAMVMHRMLARTPSLGELRIDQPGLGINEWDVVLRRDGQEDTIPLRDVYRYSLPVPIAVSRATIAARVMALSSYWDVLLNTPAPSGSGTLVSTNPWYVIKKRVSRGLRDERRAARTAQRMQPELVARLLRFSEQQQSLTALRDKALLYLLVFMGLRISEALRIRRAPPVSSETERWPGWFEPTEPPSLVVVRKGGKKVRLPYPPIALKALVEMQTELARVAAPPDAQMDSPKRASYVPPGSPRWRYRELARSADAPLIPPLRFWGANNASNYRALKPNTAGQSPFEHTWSMTRSGAFRLLRRMAMRAGFSREQVRQVHPHALRHFALTAMVRGGKPLLEVAAIAGHESVTTTEQYLEDIQDAVALSGQTQILEYLSEVDPGPATPPAPPQGEVEAVGIEVPGGRQPEPLARADQAGALRLAAEPEPAAGLPAAPAFSPPTARAVPTAKGTAVEVEDRVVSLGGKEPEPDSDEVEEVQLINNVSAGSPDWVYEAMEAGGKTRERVHMTLLGKKDRAGQVTVHVDEIKRRGGQIERVEKAQRDTWLREHYNPWPLHYGLGSESLLPWYAKGNTNRYGYVVLSGREVAPLPVLSPEQVSPETVGGKRLLDFVERLYDQWLNGDPEQGIAPSPSRTYGLVRWFGFFAYTTWKLQQYLANTSSRVDWQPYNCTCRLGRDIRSHESSWIESWLAKNAHTYTTAQRAFAHVPRGKGLVDEDDFWLAFEAASFEGLNAAIDIPDWFAHDDPIKDLAPAEYDRFAKWLANVTGQRMSRLRDDERREQARSSEKTVTQQRDELEGLLEIYLADVVEVAELTATGDHDEARTRRFEMRAMEQRFAELGLASPTSEPFVSIPTHKARIRALLDDWTSRNVEAEAADANAFAASPLFDAEWFRIDRRRNTISHTDAFREQFRRQYGQDSELVLRRAARAMWEHVKAHQLEGKQLPASKYTLLYSIMLCYISWVVPAGDVMERRMAARGIEAVPAGAMRREWLSSQLLAVRDMVWREVDEEGEVDEAAMVAQIQQRYGLDEMSAMEAYRHARMLEEYMQSEAERGESELRGFEEMLGEGARVFAPGSAAEERKAFAAARAEAEGPRMATRLLKTKQLTPNQRIRVVHLKGERPRGFYRYGERDGTRVYLSNGAWASSHHVGETARELLPSPFAMIRAMTSFYPRK